jgi:conjugative relaxase-like TrwC/TraI family protein
MLTIKAQTSPRDAVRYFKEHLSRGDYYSEKLYTVGKWFGEGCHALGLESGKDVRQEDFVALCKGLRPDTHTKLTQRMKIGRRCLYDLTLSAPKSISVMALVANDERIIAAHERAVTAAMQAAERLAAARVRKGFAVDTRESRVTANVVSARFLHRESRALDPQLHTHCVTFNVTHDPVEFRLKALEARPIYDGAPKVTAIYREHLAQSLHALGYETYRDRHHAPQICGVDVAIMEQFSKRSAERDELVAQKEKELGRALTKRDVAKIVHENRAKKQKQADPLTLRKAQLEQLSGEQRSRLERVKQNALDVSAGLRPEREAPQRQPPIIPPPRIATPPTAEPPQPKPHVPGPWIATIRLAMLAARSVNTDPYLFSPHISFEQRVFLTVRHLQQVQRAQAIVRQMERGERGISR